MTVLAVTLRIHRGLRPARPVERETCASNSGRRASSTRILFARVGLNAVPVVLIVAATVGVLAVIGGNVLAQVGARRRLDPGWAFTTAPALADGETGVIGSASTVTAPRAKRVRRRWAMPRLHRPSSSTVLFTVSLAFFAAVGGVLVFHYGSLMGDAESRVADAWYVFFSRDPHLAAVGFVWNPLPSILVMPFFLFKSVWPALTTRAFAGNLASALFMAGCVVELRRILRDLGTSRFVTAVLLVIFVLNPMIVFYGANGMTEAFYLFFLLVALRYLMRWLSSGGMVNLVVVGVALGLDYLVRYEALAAAGAVGAVVGYVTFRRASGTTRERLETAAADLVVFGLPPAASFIGWAIVSYVITGQPFQQLSSQYGNASQLQVLGVQHGQFSTPVAALIVVFAWCPLLPIPAIAAAIVANARRDPRLIALAVLAGTAAFSLLAMLSGQAVVNLRFFMPLLPLWLICVGYLSTRVPEPTRADWSVWTRRIGVALAALSVGAGTVVATGWAMDQPDLASAEFKQLDWVVRGRANNPTAVAAQAYVPSVTDLTRKIDRLHLPPSSIVADTFTECVSLVLMTSSHPHQFVITSDRDFQRTLVDPPTFHAHYLLVPPPNGYGSLDAVTRAYPTLYNGGLRGAQRIAEFPELGCPTLRLYKLTRSLRG